MSGREVRRRWRLILGGHAEQARPAGKPGERGSAGAAGEGASGGATGKGAARLDALDRERDVLLEFLFRRERSRGGAGRGSRRHEARGAGGGDRGSLTPVTWLHEVRKVFPKSSVETLQRTAIDRYGLVDLLTDPEALKAAEPSLDLVGTLLAFRDSLPPAAMGEVRRIVGTVVREVEERLAQKIRQHFGGRRRRHQHGGRPLFANLDWRRTIARNLEHYDAGHETLVLERLYFHPRDRRRIPWHVLLVVDQSGSMADSVIYSAVIGSVLLKVPSLAAQLLLFDTEVVDLSGRLDDPLETLLSVQLGGGTDIALAMGAARERVTQPQRTILVLVSDFDEGGSVSDLVAHVAALTDSGVTLLGLAALTDASEPYFNRDVARRLADAGMTIGAMTPDRLAEWIAERVR